MRFSRASSLRIILAAKLVFAAWVLYQTVWIKLKIVFANQFISIKSRNKVVTNKSGFTVRIPVVINLNVSRQL